MDGNRKNARERWRDEGRGAHLHATLDWMLFLINFVFYYFIHTTITAGMTPEDQVVVLTELRDRVIETALATTGRS